MPMNFLRNTTYQKWLEWKFKADVVINLTPLFDGTVPEALQKPLCTHFNSQCFFRLMSVENCWEFPACLFIVKPQADHIGLSNLITNANSSVQASYPWIVQEKFVPRIKLPVTISVNVDIESRKSDHKKRRPSIRPPFSVFVSLI